MRECGFDVIRERIYPALYKGIKVGDYRPDLIVDNTVVIEVKSVERYNPVFLAQMLTYLRITGMTIGLLLNFNRPVLRDGIKRVVL